MIFKVAWHAYITWGHKSQEFTAALDGQERTQYLLILLHFLSLLFFFLIYEICPSIWACRCVAFLAMPLIPVNLTIVQCKSMWNLFSEILFWSMFVINFLWRTTYCQIINTVYVSSLITPWPLTLYRTKSPINLQFVVTNLAKFLSNKWFK